MKIRLSSRDIELICFLGRYKQIKAVDCKKIYQSKDYHRKRLKVLEKGKYIKRENIYYIKIDIEGRKLLQDFGYGSYNLFRNRDYQERIKDITKIAMIAFEDDILKMLYLKKYTYNCVFFFIFGHIIYKIIFLMQKYCIKNKNLI